MSVRFEVVVRNGMYYVVSFDMGRELATVFYDVRTAKEIRNRVNEREKFFRAIPHVPLYTPFPRPDDCDVSGTYPDEVKNTKKIG